jgi:DNA-binding transcriptional ArsR family regulator
MDAADSVERAASRIASAIGEPARSRILFCLMDGRARTSTELSAVADVGTSTASVHLDRLVKARLVRVAAEGRYRYYSLAGPEVAGVLEGLTAIAGAGRAQFVPSTPGRLRQARSCYDHLAGSLGVRLHDRLLAMGWVSDTGKSGVYALSEAGRRGLSGIGIDADGLGGARRRFAYGCLDWSERRCHLAGSLGAAILELMLRKKWLLREHQGRGLALSSFGRREFRRAFGLEIAG